MPRAAQPLELSELAARLGPDRELSGRTNFLIHGCAAIDAAAPDEIAFVRSEAYIAAARSSRAGALIVPLLAREAVVAALGAGGERALLFSPNPDRDFASALAWLAAAPRPATGVDTTASVASDAQLASEVSIGPGCVVGAGSQVGARSVLHPNVVIYPDVHIGEDCEIHANTVVREGTRIGDRVRLQPGVLIGGDGFGLSYDEAGAPQAVPQVGCVVIEDDVEIGAGSAVDRATLGETRIGRGSKIDDLVMIAHNVEIGPASVIAAQSGLAGSVKLGARVIVLAQAGIGDHVEVGAGSFVAARAGVGASIGAGARVWGFPARAGRAWHRQVAALARLPAALKRLRRIEKKLGIETSDGAGVDEEES